MISINLRSLVAGGAASAALALALGPAAAGADTGAVTVCNEAGAAFVGGTLSVVDPTQDPNPPARHKANLEALPGQGVGLVRAAANSPALAVCAVPAPPAPPASSGGDVTDLGSSTGTDTGGGFVLSGDNG